MNERAIFIEALDRDTPGARAAYLDEACAGDQTLRARVEALLQSHEQAGEFPGKLAPQRLADEFAAREPDDTRTGPTGPDAGGGLDFLEPSDKQGSIGRLGHYEVQEVIGRGGMGVVLRAFDERLHRVVAIKVMAAELATSAAARRRFTREARAAAAITHDHVVTIHAVEEGPGLPYLVMQYVAGVSLQDRLDRTGPLPLAEVLRIGMQVVGGLAAAHAQGLVHRDVKPANILLENGVERVKLTDFGLARAADDASLTQSGAVAGTPSFMSPEQAEGKPVDHRSDLFSLGGVLYAMCTGRPPFRAGSSMGVLKRVCEDTPTPIREINPEVPDWLVAVVEKLHAKDPADRFPSAAEVAGLLGQLLAHVQHPSAVPPPAIANPPDRPPAPAPPAGRRRWAGAAVVLAATLVALGAAEATGVTNFRASVIRIFTPEGTLVVETDDPAVKVTVEGDGDLVLTGDGPEVRLRVGSYWLHAAKDGKPVKLDRDLVNITRDDRQIVRLRLEGDASAAVPPTAERGAFVLMGGQGVAERKSNTLAEAVEVASDGDTIEVRGNGPFVTGPLKTTTRQTIRAGEGFHPIIRFHSEDLPANASYLRAEAALALEGLEFQCTARDLRTGELSTHLLGTWEELHVANCRFLMRKTTYCILTGSPVAEIRNCEFLIPDAPGGGVVWLDDWVVGQRLILDNCLLTASIRGGTANPRSAHGAVVRLTRNTWRTRMGGIWFNHAFAIARGPKDLNERPRLLSVYASGNVVDTDFVFRFSQFPPDKAQLPSDLEKYVAHVVDWIGERNLYVGLDHMFGLYPQEEFAATLRPVRTLADWNRFWQTGEAGSTEGRVRYHGGDLLTRLEASSERLTPEDFRLRPDSAGYRAGKDGKDIGADVDLVGPGAAYERWKKTPAYQQWLRDTGQVRK
jgi:hypothetical protein